MKTTINRLSRLQDRRNANSRADSLGIATAAWNFMARTTDHRGPSTAPRWSPEAMETTARSFLRLRSEGGDEAIRAWALPRDSSDDPSGFFLDLHRSDPEAAERLAQGIVSLPEPGTEFLGFRLVQELGRGAFGRVYLALQGDLADRPVALKVSSQMPGECRTLAKLQHTNIVPIYSAHNVPPLHAVCMPFFGAATLSNVFEALEESETLPDSGQALIRTLESKRSHLSRTYGSTRVDSSQSQPHSTLALVEASDTNEIPAPLRALGRLSFVEAVLWLGARLADGLAHAHERGIVHRDLKPANILLTDDGQPMILDFNLSDDASGPEDAASASMGGTLPYMAPEHLDAFSGGRRQVDARSDLYALGVILFELLTGGHPFPSYTGHSLRVIQAMIDDRKAALPGIRVINPHVTPAVESIIHHLLAFDPDRRYQTAADLREDIERHLANLPLQHAPEPSLVERARKWARRHPRIASGTTLAAVAGVAFCGALALFAARANRLERLEAYQTLAAFHDQMDTVEYLLNTEVADPARRDRGIAQARLALALYRVGSDPQWANEAAVARLDPDDRQKLRGDLGTLATLLARALTLSAKAQAEGPSRAALAGAARSACDLAGACFAADQVPRTLWEQRAEVADLLGRPEEAKAARDRAAETPLRTARDRSIAAAALAAAGEYRRALPLARKATQEDPRSLTAWLELALCHDRLDQNAEAIACYGTCIALRPDFAYAWLDRGIVSIRRDENDSAVADFDRAAALRPKWFEPYLNRGIAHLNRRDPAAAASDFTRALDLGGPDCRTLMLRAVALERAGDAEGARRDREAGLKLDPKDEPGWIARGMARLDKDAAGALADFRKAIELNPRSLPALQDSVYALCALNRLDETLALLDRIVAMYPDHAPSRSSRGVLRAIKGDRQGALSEAKESVWRDTSPKNLYQVAGIYATTSKQAPDDRIEAFRLLSTALRGGFGFEEYAEDHELDAIRDLPEFREVLASARAQVKANAAPAPRGGH